MVKSHLGTLFLTEGLLIEKLDFNFFQNLLVSYCKSFKQPKWFWNGSPITGNSCNLQLFLFEEI